LKDKFIFKSVRVDEGGYGISWDDEIDLSEYELWKNGTEINFNKGGHGVRCPIDEL
jgi:hypothetical protein